MTTRRIGLKLVFCGTPQFAVPTLEALLAAGHEIALVVSQPDRPVGRDQQLTPPPVKQAALAAGIPVTQPEKIRNNAEFRAQLEAIAPDAIVVVAYGRIIPPWMLALPRLGCINLHASLLPKYRGAAPIQWAIAMGDAFTGNTTMLLEEGLDTGPILLQQTIEIGPDQTADGSFPSAGARRRAAGRRDAGGLGERHDPPAAAESRGRDLRAAARPRRRAHRFCRAHGARNLQSLARISALARRVHHSQWQKADRPSHGHCPRKLRRGPGLRRAGLGSSSRTIAFWLRAPVTPGSSSSKFSSKARSA